MKKICVFPPHNYHLNYITDYFEKLYSDSWSNEENENCQISQFNLNNRRNEISKILSKMIKLNKVNLQKKISYHETKNINLTFNESLNLQNFYLGC